MAKVILTENLSKAYQLGDFGTGTLSRDLERMWARIRGKEDPFLKIGEANDRTTKGSSDIVWSLRDLNFSIEQGDAVGIIGRNGAGKSTLLKILSRVTYPTAGTIKIKGRIASLLEVGTGFHPELSGRENIYLNGAILGMRKKEITRKFDEIVDFAGVERYIDTPVKRYSSGMYVRLAFAVAAHLESEILIVDEVLAVGDAEFQKKCLGKMGDVSKAEGRTILFVSHNMTSIENLCTKGLLLNNGSIAYLGSADGAIRQYTNQASNEVVQHEATDFELNNYVKISSFIVSPLVESNQDLSYHIEIESAVINNISSLVALIFDDRDQRMAVIDLRNTDLFKISSNQNTVKIDGAILGIPLLPGFYKMGIFIQSNMVSGDFRDIVHFEVKQKKLTDDVLPYDLEHRGKIGMAYHFTVS